MARTSREFLALKRKQLDVKLGDMRTVPMPRDGWIRTIRDALGMSAAQLGKRLGVSQQAAADLERREKSGSITISTLAAAAEALECDVHVIFVPTSSLDQTVRRQAETKARATRNRVVHTMRLEAQDAGVADAFVDRGDPHVWLRQCWRDARRLRSSRPGPGACHRSGDRCARRHTPAARRSLPA